MFDFLDDYARTEYAVEIYNEDHFVRQVDIFQEYEEARDYAKSGDIELSEGEYIVVNQIYYDEPNEYGDEPEIGLEVVAIFSNETEDDYHD